MLGIGGIDDPQLRPDVWIWIFPTGELTLAVYEITIQAHSIIGDGAIDPALDEPVRHIQRAQTVPRRSQFHY